MPGYRTLKWKSLIVMVRIRHEGSRFGMRWISFVSGQFIAAAHRGFVRVIKCLGFATVRVRRAVAW